MHLIQKRVQQPIILQAHKSQNYNEPDMHIAVIDIVFIVIMLASGIACSIKGFFTELGAKASYVIGGLVSIMFTKQLLYYSVSSLGIDVNIVSALIVFLILFYVGFILCRATAGICTKALDGIKLKFIDIALGFILGIVECFAAILIIVFILRYQNVIDVQSILVDSYMYNKIMLPLINNISSIGI